jgi:glyceraldehyde 3-phosphate dehydrogenase
MFLVYDVMNPVEIPWVMRALIMLLNLPGIFEAQNWQVRTFKAGCKKVVLSAPAKDDTPTFVCGV